MIAPTMTLEQRRMLEIGDIGSASTIVIGVDGQQRPVMMHILDALLARTLDIRPPDGR